MQFLAITKCARLLRCIGEVLFRSKKVPNGKNDLKTVKSEAQNQRKRVSAIVAQNPLKTNVSSLTPIRRCFARTWCPGPLLHFLIEISLSRWNNRCGLAKLWGILQVQGNTMAHLQMGSLERTIWQLRPTKVGQRCGETAACADRA
jgi:hypothetical protein